jgi:hypothetical protein
MRKFFVITFLAVFAGPANVVAQNPATSHQTQQTARQALIEMFLGKGEDDFTKHLPEDARRTLLRKGETPDTSAVLKIAMIGRQMSASGSKLETFDTGSTLLVSQESGSNEKFEVTVQHDSLMGENDEIEVSVEYYKNGQLVPLPVIPRLTFTFRQEKEIWRLTELTAAAHVPLTDPDYLKGVRKQEDESVETQAKWRVSMITAAETSYIDKHPDQGYTCSLQSLFARDPNASPETPAPFDPGQGNEEWYGYQFAITGCEGTPPSKYRVTATPSDPDADLKTFCTDQSGQLKFIESDKPSNCFSRGHAVGSEGNGD